MQKWLFFFINSNLITIKIIGISTQSGEYDMIDCCCTEGISAMEMYIILNLPYKLLYINTTKGVKLLYFLIWKWVFSLHHRWAVMLNKVFHIAHVCSCTVFCKLLKMLSFLSFLLFISANMKMSDLDYTDLCPCKVCHYGGVFTFIYLKCLWTFLKSAIQSRVGMSQTCRFWAHNFATL